MGSQGDPHSLPEEEEEEEEEGRGRPPMMGQQPGTKGPQEEWEEEEWSPQKLHPYFKRSYWHQPKPPYSYVALIALALQTSPEKRLQVPQILQELDRLFPYFAGCSDGWRESIKRTLHQNPCFLKERPKYGGNWNIWRVDVAQLTRKRLLRRSYRKPLPEGFEDPFPFIPDLSPFILDGEPFLPPPFPRKPLPGPMIETHPKDGGTLTRTGDLWVGAEDSLLADQGGPNPDPRRGPSLPLHPLLSPSRFLGPTPHFSSGGPGFPSVAHFPLPRGPYSYTLPPPSLDPLHQPPLPPGDQAPLPCLSSGSSLGHWFSPAPLVKGWDGNDGHGSTTDPGDQAPLPCPPSGATPGLGVYPLGSTASLPYASPAPLVKKWDGNDGHGSTTDPGPQAPLPCPPSGAPPGLGVYPLDPTASLPYASPAPLVMEWDGSNGHGSTTDPGDQAPLPCPPSWATPGLGVYPLGPTASLPCASPVPLVKEWDGNDGHGSTTDPGDQAPLPSPPSGAPPGLGFYPLAQSTPSLSAILDHLLEEWGGGDAHGPSTDPADQPPLPLSGTSPGHGVYPLGQSAPSSSVSQGPLLMEWDEVDGHGSSTDPGDQAPLPCPPSGAPPGHGF